MTHRVIKRVTSVVPPKETAPLLREFQNALKEKNYNRFRELLNNYDPDEIYDLYDDLFHRMSYDTCVIMDLLIESGFRGNRKQTLFNWLYNTYLANDEFRCKYMFVLLEAGYDIKSTKRAKMDGANMARLMVYGRIYADEVSLLKRFLTYQPDLSEEIVEGNDLIDSAIYSSHPQQVFILIDYGVGSHKSYLKNINSVLDRLRYDYPDLSESVQLSDFTEEDFRQDPLLKSYLEALNYLRQHTATITKSSRSFIDFTCDTL